ncbi:MAG: putative sigma-54 modulation protein [Candidatus Paceibacteria bacterium]|jgi:putative sigma-54 modulation protein
MAINIIIKTKNFDLTPSLRDHVNNKVGSLERFINLNKSQEAIAEVDIGIRSKRHRKGNKYRAELNLTCDGNTLRSVKKCEDIFQAIDECCSDMGRNVTKNKSKKISRIMRGAQRAKELFKGLRRK